MLIFFCEKVSIAHNVRQAMACLLQEDFLVVANDIRPTNTGNAQIKDQLNWHNRNVWIDSPQGNVMSPYAGPLHLSLHRNNSFYVSDSAGNGKYQSLDGSFLEGHEFVCVNDNDGQHELSFSNLIGLIGLPEKVSSMRLISMGEKGIQYSYHKKSPFDFYDRKLKIAYANQLMDDYFFINGKEIYPDILKECKTNNISKEEMLFLFKLRDEKLNSEALNEWIGSDKRPHIHLPYLSVEEGYYWEHHRVVRQVFDNMEKHGLIIYFDDHKSIEVDKDNNLQMPNVIITPEGYDFIDCVSKVYCDYDMLARLTDWGSTCSYAEINKKVKAYIINYFKKLKKG